jgi:GTP cyclohydrolase I
MKSKIHPLSLEITRPGNANGISLQLQKLIDQDEIRSLSVSEKQIIIRNAAKGFAIALEALGCDYENDPNSESTPMRMAKAYVEDLWKGRYELLEEITSFPSDGYKGIVLEKDIPLISSCSHHHQAIVGKVHIAYIPGQEGRVIGLSKLNRIVEHFGRRGAIQEQLTMAIHSAVSNVITGNNGVIVIVHATHGCVSCRGVRHQGASMVTSQVSGVFADPNDTAKQEVMDLISHKL